MLKRTFKQQADRPVLWIQEPDGTYREASAEDLIQAALSEIEARFTRGIELPSPTATREFLKLELAHLEHEAFAVLWLDNRHRVIAFEELFHGTIDGASVHPREIVKAALSHNAAACILCHNHPSGNAAPSCADRALTTRVRDALELVNVRVLDHIVVASNTCSFAELGLL